MSYLTDERMRDSNFKYLFNELISFKKLMLGKNEESKKNFQNLIDTPGHLDFSGNITDTLFLVDNAIIMKILNY